MLTTMLRFRLRRNQRQVDCLTQLMCLFIALRVVVKYENYLTPLTDIICKVFCIQVNILRTAASVKRLQLLSKPA